MTASAEKDFARALLRDVAPAEEEFLDAYYASISTSASGRPSGTGMGLPPEIGGALGAVAVLVGKLVYEKLAQWASDAAAEIAKKVVVDTGSEKLKKWLLGPSDLPLEGVLTKAGEAEIVAIVERDARASGSTDEEVSKIRNAVIRRLGLKTTAH